MSAEGNDIAQLLAPTCLRQSIPQPGVTACGDTDMLLCNMQGLWLSVGVGVDLPNHNCHTGSMEVLLRVCFTSLPGDAVSYTLNQ